MKLGVDFGTTRIVVAAADRGNYPVAAFECPDGAVREWFPPLVAATPSGLVTGWEAWMMQTRPGVTVVRSLKRWMAEAGPHTRVQIGDGSYPMLDVLTILVRDLRTALQEHSSLTVPAGERPQILLGVPANANSNQRFLTVEAFRLGGFEVLGLLNEPSAASVEYSHRMAKGQPPERVLVYDFGGGTFDVSLVAREDRNHNVVATEGIATLGGDDFDEILAELALENAGKSADRGILTPAQEFTLAEECREKKEGLHPNTRRIVVDLEQVVEGWGQATVPVAEYYDRCTPMIEETLRATDELLARLSPEETVSLYITGGGSELPIVARLLRDRFGRRVKRSAYTRSATAIGLAIQADAESGYQLRERFTRYFGVWREGEEGRVAVFDSLFERGTPLPTPGEAELTRTRSYKPVHNIGHFRYAECSHLGADGRPCGDFTNWDEIRFPFDPALREAANLARLPVERSDSAASHWIEERFTTDASGAVLVTISNATAGYSFAYRLGRWAAPLQPGPAVIPTPRRRKKAAR